MSGMDDKKTVGSVWTDPFLIIQKTKFRANGSETSGSAKWKSKVSSATLRLCNLSILTLIPMAFSFVCEI